VDASSGQRGDGKLAAGMAGPLKASHRRPPQLVVLVAVWVLLAALGTLWAFANPMGNSPDEPAQVARAASLVRGHPFGDPVAGQEGPFSMVRVPRTYALQLDFDAGLTGAHDCFHFRPAVPASCEHLTASSAPVRVATYIGHYPLLFYAVVGLPSLATDGIGGLYLMRLVACVLDSFFLALGITMAWRWASSRLLLAAVLVAATPTEIFLASTVNASGLEIATAICAWVGGAVLVVDAPSVPAPSLIAGTAAAMSVLALTRPISLFWLALIVVIVAIAGWGKIPLRRWLRQRSVQVAAVTVVAASVFSAAWVVLEGSLAIIPEGVPVPGTPLSKIVAFAVADMWLGFGQAAGTFGWNDTHEPALAVAALVVAVLVPVVLCLAHARTRQVIVLLLIIFLSAAVPLAMVLATVHHDGFQEQGRYFMPLWVGIPIFAAATQGSLPALINRRMTALLVVPSAAGLVIAFWWNLHRATVGIGGPYLPWARVGGSWSPPLLSATAFDAATVLVVAAYAAAVLTLANFVQPRPEPLPRAPSESRQRALAR
jgi:hypothetical protein